MVQAGNQLFLCFCKPPEPGIVQTCFGTSNALQNASQRRQRRSVAQAHFQHLEDGGCRAAPRTSGLHVGAVSAGATEPTEELPTRLGNRIHRTQPNCPAGNQAAERLLGFRTFRRIKASASTRTLRPHRRHSSRAPNLTDASLMPV